MSDLTNWYAMAEETAPVTPICTECDEPIIEDEGYKFGFGWICCDCMKRAYTLIEGDF